MKTRRLVLLALLGTLIPVSSASTAAICDQGGFSQPTCNVTNSHDITGQSITDSNTDINVKKGGRLYTNHKNKTNNPVAKIDLQDGDFHVYPGGAVHANINISAYNIIIEKGGVIDASGLGWQAADDYSTSCKFGDFNGYCLGGGPAGGVSGGSNSNQGAGGAGHAGKGGSYKSTDTKYFSGGGYGPINNETYGRRKKPYTYGSGAGAQKNSLYLTDANGDNGLVKASSLGEEEGDELVYNMTAVGKNGDGQDDPDNDALDSNQWISTGAEYRANNSYDILMGSGGGVIKLTASNKLLANGTIISNGLDGYGSPGSSGYSPGGGAGGSIWLTAGGMFGQGKIIADGGDMMEERVDTNTYPGGGGGGRVYYTYSIKGDNWDWNVSADEGYGINNINDSNNGNKKKGEVATNGTIYSQIAFSADVNTTIVNPEDPIYINGTASSTVKAKINGTLRGKTKPDSDDGSYNLTINALNINSTKNLGNYTLTVSSTISGSTIEEKFDVSHRKINITHSSDYFLAPYERFKTDSRARLYKEDGRGGSKAINYSNGEIFFRFFSGNDLLNESIVKTNSKGEFSVTDKVPPIKGRKYFTTTAENSQNITGFKRKNISLIGLNDTIVDPGQFIKINGSAHNNVDIYLNNSLKDSATPNANGYFETTIQSLIINNDTELGNYTLRAETLLNEKIRVKKFEISHRDIEINQSTDYLLQPGENFTVTGTAVKILEDGQGGTKKVNYSDQSIDLNFQSNNSKIRTETQKTNGDGEFYSSSLFEMPLEIGAKKIIAKTENPENIQGRDSISLGLVQLNDTILPPGDTIKVNGTAFNKIRLYFNSSKVASDNPNNQKYFATQYQTPEFSDKGKFGNYSLKVKTSLNSKNRTEQLDISLRGIRFNISWKENLKPGENFTISGNATLYKADGNGGSKAVNYSNEELNITYTTNSSQIYSEKVKTDSNGYFQTSNNFQSPLEAGSRSLKIVTRNAEGINRRRYAPIDTLIKTFNGKTNSQSRKLYKDTSLQRTRYINPNQNVTFKVTTYRSIDFIKTVYASVTLPDGTKKRVNLSATNVLGTNIGAAQDWDSAKTTHLSHFNTSNRDPKKIRIGYRHRNSNRPQIILPMDGAAGSAEDISGKDNDAEIQGSVARGVSGTFSTSSFDFNGGYLTVGSSEDTSKLDIDGSFTVSAWIKDASANEVIYSRSQEGTTESEPELFIDSSGEAVIKFGNSNSKEKILSSGVDLTSDNNWHHVAGQFDAKDNKLRIYVDGDLKANTSVSFNNTEFKEQPLIGAREIEKSIGTEIKAEFSGKMDDLQVFNKSLSRSEISKLASKQGRAVTSTIKTDEKVKDILKLLDFKGKLRGQKISLRVLSDPDEDGNFSQKSDKVTLSSNKDKYSITGLENKSDRFRLEINLITSNLSKSPTLDEIDLKARKDTVITWEEEKSISKFFGGQFGTYSTVYKAEDYAGNEQVLKGEKSNFTVRNITINANHTVYVAQGSKINITGNVTIKKGDGNGGIKKENFAGKISILYNDTVLGKNKIPESPVFENISNGDKARIRVNGSLQPSGPNGNPVITFIGKYSGVEELKNWNSTKDWDNYRSRTGLVHGSVQNSLKKSDRLVLGYSPKEVVGNGLTGYYSLDESYPPAEDNTGKTSSSKDADLSAFNGTDLSVGGIASSEAASLKGSQGLNSSKSVFDSPTKKFTINAWVKPTSISADKGEFGQGRRSPNTVLSINNPDRVVLQLTRNNEVFAAVNTSKGTYNLSTNSDILSTGNWHMLTLRYDSGGLELFVDGSSTPITSNQDASGSIDPVKSGTYLGMEPNADDSFKGKIDEIRIFNSSFSSTQISDLHSAADSGYILTNSKEFSEKVNPNSLILKDVESDTRSKTVYIQIRSNYTTGGGYDEKSDLIELKNDKTKYDIKGLSKKSKHFGFYIVLQGNKTTSPQIDSLKLARRASTIDPGVDIDSDSKDEANISGRLLGGEKVTRNLTELDKGVTNATFTATRGTFTTRLNYTERLVSESKSYINVNSTGGFNTTLKVPKGAGRRKISYFITNSRGIHGRENTKTIAGLQFNYSSIRDLENGDKIADTDDSFKVNATLDKHLNHVERVWAKIGTPKGNSFTRNLTKDRRSWKNKTEINNIFDSLGTYSISLKAIDSEGIREFKSPTLPLKVTNGTVSVKRSDKTVGLGRKFNLNGTVRSQLSGEKVNATVNATIPYSGENKTTVTNNTGFYSLTLEAPSKVGTYDIVVKTEDENNVTGLNKTEIGVNDTTSISLSVPSSTIYARSVTLDDGQNKTFTVNISNDGDTDAKNLTVYMQDLPTIKSDYVLEEYGAHNWSSINRTYNIESGTSESVKAEVWVSEATETHTFENINVSTIFTTSGGETKRVTKEVDIRVAENRRPLFTKNISVSAQEGFEGNVIPPDDIQNGSVRNKGTGTAVDAGWTVEKGRVKSWINGFVPSKDPELREGSITGVPDNGDIPSGESIPLYQINTDIPQGNPPGNYSTTLETFSTEPTQTNKINLSISIENKPSYSITLEPIKSDVRIPEGEINLSNPIQLGKLETGAKNEVIFNVTLNNTGNRDLDWTLESTTGTGDTEERFYFNSSDIGPSGGILGVEEYESNITEESNYTFNIPDKEPHVLYKVSSSAKGGIYKANLTISCNYPISGDKLCENSHIVLPMNGTVQDPPPEFSGLDVPNYTGVDQSVYFGGFAKDNNNVEDVNITLVKDLDGKKDKETLTDVSLNLTGGFEVDFAPKKEYDEGTSDNQEPDIYSIRFKAMDSAGQFNTSEPFNLTVKESADLAIKRDTSSVTFDNITATHGDSVYITGNIKGGKAKVTGLNLSFTTDAPSKFAYSNSEINIGTLKAGERKSFNLTLESASNIDPLKTFTANINSEWVDPDGSSRQPDYESGTKSIELNIAANKIADVSHGASDTETIQHNSTGSEVLKLFSAGNSELKDIQFKCVDCDQSIYISSFNRSGVDLESGNTINVKYNITVEEFVESTTVGRDIKVKYDSGKTYLNNTVIDIPADKAVTTEPDNITAAIPKGQGDVNITDITTENIGNSKLDLEVNVNDSAADIFVGQSKQNTYTFSISPGGTDKVKIKSDSDTIELGKHFYKIRPKLSGTGRLDQKDPINLTVFVQDIGYNITSINKTASIIAGDKIKIKFNLTKQDEAINDSKKVDLKLEIDGNTYDIAETYDSSQKLWISEFDAPDVEDGVNHTYNFEVTSSAFKSTISESEEVSYKDITPPTFTNFTAESVKSGNDSRIKVELEDKSQIADVSGTVEKPSDSTIVDLKKISSETFALEFNETSDKGLYTVTLTATDKTGNERTQTEFFRVYKPLEVNGTAVEAGNKTTIKLLNPNGEISEKITPTNGTYNTTVKSGEYQVKINLPKGQKAVVEDFKAKQLSQHPPEIDPRVESYSIDVKEEVLTGYGLSSKGFENITGATTFDYSRFLENGAIEYEGNLQILKCEDYNVEGETCDSGFEAVPTGIDSGSDVAVTNISGYSSYILVENESSSTDTSLNVNITGDLGNFSSLENLSSIEDLNNLDSLLKKIESNTEEITDSSGGTSGGGGGVGEGKLKDLISELNDTEGKRFLVGNNKISISLQPGQIKSTAISVQNSKSTNTTISLTSTDNLERLLNFTKEIPLKPGEFRTVKIEVDARNKTKLKEYSGFIQLKGGETERSIPVSIKIVGAENRLLDVSLEPTVNSFQPGKTARIKLSFSNQGFSRAVDAKTAVKIVDITEDKVVARKTQTFAVQTTLDKIVTLDLPKDTEIGTYEVRANVEYSNIASNRSATAVGQVQISKPFWQRKTLGVKNLNLLLAAIILIIIVSVGGYYYYRKKKLEEKRKRFEEQVDNDAIPSEAGRTAFVGKLSEIGTRAFINLEDLKTHCLTAGATGAGKSVAAQVLVEEALEQGVNVIVLDPTGQWSGYLEKNENDEFFAFYDDFGMSESDARSYQGNIRAVDAEQDTIDITDMLRPQGDEGSIHVFSMHKLENAELEEYLSDTIQQIFDYNPEEKDQLETLIVYDEAHRVLEKFGGTGRGVKMLERGAREFRKWGVGMVMISQVIEDFPEEVRANIGTQIQMRTEYEGDLDRIERKYGNHISQGVTKANTGTGMLENSSYNHGRPYFVDFRPIKHSPERLSDEELEKFEKYNRRVDEIEDMISILEEDGEDVFEYQSQLKLVKKNIRKRSFNLVETYLDELEEDLNNELDL